MVVWPPTGWTHILKCIVSFDVVRVSSRLSFQIRTWRTNSPGLRGKCRLVSIYYICGGFQSMKRKLITVKETLNSSVASCYLAENSLWLAKVCYWLLGSLRFNRTRSFSSACASRRILHLQCTASLSPVVKVSHTNLSRKEKASWLITVFHPCCMSWLLWEGKMFFAKPGDWENLRYSVQPTAMRDSIGRRSTNAVQMVLAGVVSFFFPTSKKMSCLFLTVPVDQINWRGTSSSFNAILVNLKRLNNSPFLWFSVETICKDLQVWES